MCDRVQILRATGIWARVRRAHGTNVSRTGRHFGYARPTVHRWLVRYDRLRLETLEDTSSAPVRRRRPTWTLREPGAGPGARALGG